MTRNLTMTQSYYGAGEYDNYPRASHRAMTNAAYYDRPGPYGYYEQPRQELRSEYGGRVPTQALIEEPEPETAPGSSRRRIAVAVRRAVQRSRIARLT